jgi:uncharacterized protein YqeY
MIESKVNELWKKAMLERSNDKHIFSAVRAEIKNENIKMPWSKRPIKDEEIVNLIRRMIKQRKETVELIKDSGRADAIDKENYEINVLLSLLPKQLSDEELEKTMTEILLSYEPGTIDEGRAMGILMPKLRSVASAQDVRRVLKKVLAR